MITNLDGNLVESADRGGMFDVEPEDAQTVVQLLLLLEQSGRSTRCVTQTGRQIPQNERYSHHQILQN